MIKTSTWRNQWVKLKQKPVFTENASNAKIAHFWNNSKIHGYSRFCLDLNPHTKWTIEHTGEATLETKWRCVHVWCRGWKFLVDDFSVWLLLFRMRLFQKRLLSYCRPGVAALRNHWMPDRAAKMPPKFSVQLKQTNHKTFRGERLRIFSHALMSHCRNNPI